MKKYSNLVADPPWLTPAYLPGNAGGASRHYPLMSDLDICKFPLPPMMDDALLFLWRLASKQELAFLVAKMWGFSVKSEIVWIKTKNPPKLQVGMGSYVRNCHEVCLICTRGKAGSKLIKSKSVRSVIYAPRTHHSQKPNAFYELVDELTGKAPTVELFARRQWPGWHCFGNEMKGKKNGK